MNQAYIDRKKTGAEFGPVKRQCWSCGSTQHLQRDCGKRAMQAMFVGCAETNREPEELIRISDYEPTARERQHPMTELLKNATSLLFDQQQEVLCVEVSKEEEDSQEKPDEEVSDKKSDGTCTR